MTKDTVKHNTVFTDISSIGIIGMLKLYVRNGPDDSIDRCHQNDGTKTHVSEQRQKFIHSDWRTLIFDMVAWRFYILHIDSLSTTRNSWKTSLRIYVVYKPRVVTIYRRHGNFHGKLIFVVTRNHEN